MDTWFKNVSVSHSLNLVVFLELIQLLLYDNVGHVLFD